MSFVSSGVKSSTPSILKRPGKVRTSTGNTVKFQLHSDLKSLLNNILAEKNQEAYEKLVCQIRDAGNQLTDEEHIRIITDAKDCISILNEDLKLFVQVLLLLKWVHRGDDAVYLYKGFVLDLCSAHNYYTKFAIQQLVAVFLEVEENSLHFGCAPSEQEEKGFQAVHELMKSLLKLIPMSRHVLLSVIKKKFPFRTQSDRTHLNYVHNLLTITTYEPTLRREILNLIINKLVIEVDTKCSKEEIRKSEAGDEDQNVFAMEIDDVAQIADVESERDMRHNMARTLDYCLYRLCDYIYSECHDKNNVVRWDKTSVLYQDLMHIFESVILPTHGWNHTHFVILYLISFKRKLTENFVSHLWTKVTNPNVEPVMREAAVRYLAGFLCHASFISTEIIRNTLQDLVNWLHAYIDSSSWNVEDMKVTVRVHAVFYATCQALFYTINSRHSDFVNSNKGLKFLENLNLGKIVMCRFNPLQVCRRPIVNQFIKITKTYQLTYCVSVLTSVDRNFSSMNTTDLWMDGSFPFDDYLLIRSNEFMNPIRRKRRESCSAETYNDESDDEEFIPAGSLSQSSVVPVLGSSPYFSLAFGT